MEARVGDTVDVPGGMYGTVKFVGEVVGKKGRFAGVQLAAEYAVRGKNSGDVEGKYYFRTTKPGSGIFLPIDKATRRGPATPLASSLANFNQGGRTPALPKPNFSQSIGPGARAASPALKTAGRRPSLPRYDSPQRKTPALKTTPNLPTPASRPSFGRVSKNKAHTGSRYGQSPMGRSSTFSPTGRTSTFSPTLRGTSTTPNQMPLGPEPSFDEDFESTPTPTPVAAKSVDHTMRDEELTRLKSSLEEKDRQLKEQAATLADMEKSLAELQSLLPADTDSLQYRHESGAGFDEDAVQTRSIVREKNEKIQMLIAEFDAHRADFRSTIDTLEMASTETERVYEKRVEDLTQEVHDLQARCEDVEMVAQQFKQLEDLVQELEEGLEDARRGEAEAHGEVEFLRGEVERGRSELKKERGRAASNTGSRDDLNDSISTRSSNTRDIEAKDDEIRGLKAIIHSLSGSTPPSSAVATKDIQWGGGPSSHEQSTDEQRDQQLHDLEALLDEKSSREHELECELERLRATSTTTQLVPSNSSLSDKHNSRVNGGRPLSDQTIIPGSNNAGGQEQHQDHDGFHSTSRPRLDTKTVSSTTDDSPTISSLWCEICETTGHDIVTCSNMFANRATSQQGQQTQHDDEEPTTATSTTDTNGNSYSHSKNKSSTFPSRISSAPGPSISPISRSFTAPSQPPSSPPPPAAAAASIVTKSPPISTTTTATTTYTVAPSEAAGMVAGKSSGIIDPDRWCALCERDGHQSVDCPFEDGF